MELKKQLTIPNVLTLLRLCCIPWMAYLIYTEERPVYAFLIFLGIWSTDAIDGYIARHFNQISDLGKIFDPVVDKIFQLTTAIMLFLVGRLPLWVPAFIFIKELVLVIGGGMLLKKKIVVNSMILGKVATVLFTFAFAALFLLPVEYVVYVDYIFVIPVTISILAMLQYTIHFFLPVYGSKD